MTEIRNALTGQIHTDKFVGTRDEAEFYRVMPLGSTVKLFFDTVDEYAEWRCREYVEPLSWLTDEKREALREAPFDFEPAPIRTDFLSCHSAKLKEAGANVRVSA